MIKNLTKALTLVIGMIGFSLTSNAQTSTATGTASAKILAPILITAGAPLSFGDIVAGSAQGTVEMPTTGTRIATTAALSSQNEGSAATFTVGGEANYTYAITLPQTAVLTHTTDVEQTMTVSNFVTDLNERTLSGVGSDSFKVGATLTVGAAQLQGAYTGTYDVTVAYN